MQDCNLEIFADYFQFYLTDDEASAPMPEDISDEDVRLRLKVAPHIMVVQTARNMNVPVSIYVDDLAPALEASSWDHVVECSLDVPSGRLVVAGCTDYLPDATRLSVMPGTYRARVCFRGLGSLTEDGLDGDDAYVIYLWLAPFARLEVLKQYPDVAAG